MPVRTPTAAALIFAIGCGTTAAALRVAQATPSRSVWEGVYSPGQAERGAFVYGRYCQTCHGADLDGPPAGRQVPGQSPAPAIVGDEFNWKWNELTVGDLVQRIRLSMPPGNPGALSRPDSVDVFAYILAKGGFPTGETELPLPLEELQQIAFVAVRP